MACMDEIATCANMTFLKDAGNETCRWPMAELCLKTCGECKRVHAARTCSSLADECTGDFCTSHVDWRAFFERVVESHPGARLLSEERPWAAELPDFLTSDEADEIRKVGMGEGFHEEDELPHTVRNVSVTNCDSRTCMSSPFIGELYTRMSALLRLPSRNFEAIEFLNYLPGQHYTWHRDEFGWKPSKPDPATVLAGPRVLTVFFYLSTVEEGGETAFAGGPHDSKIDDSRFAGQRIRPRVMVKPVKGKAIMWANMQEDWHQSEPASSHKAMPVRKGVKWAATLWVHAHGFRIPEMYGGRECSVRGPPPS
jgi:hypothetical protein